MELNDIIGKLGLVAKADHDKIKSEYLEFVNKSKILSDAQDRLVKDMEEELKEITSANKTLQRVIQLLDEEINDQAEVINEHVSTINTFLGFKKKLDEEIALLKDSEQEHKNQIALLKKENERLKNDLRNIQGRVDIALNGLM